jgi:hypothetical protein
MVDRQSLDTNRLALFEARFRSHQRPVRCGGYALEPRQITDTVLETFALTTTASSESATWVQKLTNLVLQVTA